MAPEDARERLTGAAMPSRIALMVSILPRDQGDCVLKISNLHTTQALHVGRSSFVLTLQAEPTETYVRGQVQDLSDQSHYPIQSNRAFFDALSAFLARAERT